MRFVVLGSGTTVPDAERGPAGFLVQVGHLTWLVDGGSGTLQRCVRAGVDPRALAGGIYSHRHPDHTGDLVPLLFSMRVGPPPREAPYPIWAGVGFQAFFSGLRAAYGHWLEPAGGVDITELSLDAPQDVRLSAALRLRTAPAAHSAGALHLRFETAEGVIVFSGDTGPSAALIELATGADLLVVECAGSDAEQIPGHLWPSAIHTIAVAARPAQIWLTHLYPHVDGKDAVRTVAASGVPVRRANDGDVWNATPTQS